LQQKKLIREAYDGSLKVFRQPIYTRSFLPGEKMPDLSMTFNDDGCMMGLFRLPIPLTQTITDESIRELVPSAVPSAAEERRLLGHGDMLHDLDENYVPGNYETTLRTLMHRHTPPGVYVISACRPMESRTRDKLPQIRALNFGTAHTRFVGGDARQSESWSTKQLQTYSDGLRHVAVRCGLGLLRQRRG
jgi:hypothetical protein